MINVHSGCIMIINIFTDYCCWQPTSHRSSSTSCGTRTRNLRLRRPTPYPIRPRRLLFSSYLFLDLFIKQFITINFKISDIYKMLNKSLQSPPNTDDQRIPLTTEFQQPGHADIFIPPNPERRTHNCFTCQLLCCIGGMCLLVYIVGQGIVNFKTNTTQIYGNMSK